MKFNFQLSYLFKLYKTNIKALLNPFCPLYLISFFEINFLYSNPLAINIFSKRINIFFSCKSYFPENILLKQNVAAKIINFKVFHLIHCFVKNN